MNTVTNEIIDITIQEANNKIMKLENLLELALSFKEKVFDKTQPKSPNLEDERVDGGERQDKFLQYLITVDEKELDKQIYLIQDVLSAYNKYVDNELKRIGEYEPLKQKIIRLRDEENKPWRIIAEATHYSEKQCRRIYQDYTQKRFND